ncbi:proteasome beta subunit [Abditibacterium utsteinense]|uniref:Proteasome beta subunit n=1 Tax=Abditibacterium utsteinense TaxID=1960156 RepID=A0A2S8STY5_9BACT|nr:proteasome subunit alpha [Abditibacterium utsteinense]PQV64261.1 proteasome beta subunit [Abditibacterium utsteinense]
MSLQFNALGDFSKLVSLPTVEIPSGANSPLSASFDTHGTTVIAVKYKDGVLNVADRRATAGMAIMYDKSEKILSLDDHTLVSISGSFAKAVEIARFLRHSFKYYSRSQLQPMSLEGKLSEMTKALVQNLPMALQGVGTFVPILSAYDVQNDEGRIYAFDPMGARFESTDFSAAGSGSGPIRGSFDYITRTKGPFAEMDLQTALRECLVLLDIAADLDAATGGYAKIAPSAKAVTRDGILNLNEGQLQEVLEQMRDGLAPEKVDVAVEKVDADAI